jgi:hypothetical protein
MEGERFQQQEPLQLADGFARQASVNIQIMKGEQQ